MFPLKKHPGKLLLVDDDRDVLQAARLLLKNYYAMVHAVADPQEVLYLLETEEYDLILLDMNFSPESRSGKEGLHWLEKIKQHNPNSVVIVLTAFGDIDLAVQAMKAGAVDFVLKPWVNEKFLATISSAMQLKNTRKEVEQLSQKHKSLKQELSSPFPEIIGESAAMQKVYDTIGKVAATDANVLILGENGTGKELVARAIHASSLRKNEAFIGVDMGAIHENLFESELFGHVKGAYTDAREARAGRFEVASGGTLFLDEIGNLSLPLQAKLLAALQSRQITRVGSNTQIPVDIRLITATNMPIAKMVEKGQFRQDLLYRINTIEIQLPPLRDRLADIPVLAEHFLKIYSKKYKREQKKLSAAAMRKLEEYNWPGNVRELQHAIERAIIMSSSDTLQPNDFFFSTSTESIGKLPESVKLEDAEKHLIKKALEKYEGNISRAARQLGLTRAALYRRMEKHGL